MTHSNRKHTKMKMSEEFPSKYIKASDLQGREIKVIMSHCEREEVGQKDGRPDFKPVLYFKGKEKGLALNKTNAGVISDFYGDDSVDWADQPLILFSIKTDFQGKVVDGIRCRVPTAKDNRDTAPRRAIGGVSDNMEELRREDPISSGPPPGHPASLNDDIPF